MKIGIIVGTRPEIIKMAPVIRQCQERGIPFFIIHSNQHYSERMDAIFFHELELPSPDYNLDVGSGEHGNQTGNILIKMEPILLDEKPDLILVQGDTNTVLAGALAASKLNIDVGHIEAGLRSYDRMMPEETNRILTDHMSQFLFAVGPQQEKILITEGIAKEKIFTVGNTVSDSLLQHLAISGSRSGILSELSLHEKDYFLVTAHRASNVDIEAHLKQLLELLNKMSTEFSKEVIWPIHPRSELKIKQFGLKVPTSLRLIPPVGYLDFIQLEKHARLILTDSGGIQEEACILGVPCITLRDNTERPESVEVGANVLVGRNASLAVEAARNWLSSDEHSWENPFGDGEVARRIIDIALDSPVVKPEGIPRGQKIAVVGMGYMGLPIACLLGQAGYEVTGVDLDLDKVNAINQGLCPFDEPGLSVLLGKVLMQKRLTAAATMSGAETYLIAVPTPHNDRSSDLSYLNSAVEAIAEVAKDGQLVIVESTIPPKTCLAVEKYFSGKKLNLDVVHCPERALPGSTLHELVNNDRIIGAATEAAASKAREVYEGFVEGKIFITDQTTAECVKLVENTFRDVNIAFANELADISEELNVDVFEVISLANRHPRVNVLNPGPGVGGHCIPIDPWFLVENTRAGDFVRHAREVNDQRPKTIAKKVIELAKTTGGNKIGILGVAYKANVDDCRETPADTVLSQLHGAGFEVRYHDSLVENWKCDKTHSVLELDEWADVLMLITDHDEYSDLTVNSPLINTRA